MLAGSSWAYGEAAPVVRERFGAQGSAEAVRALPTAAGLQEVARQRAQAHDHVTLPAAQVRVERGSPAELLVGLDGGWIPSRDQSGGMEGKVGGSFTGSPQQQSELSAE